MDQDPQPLAIGDPIPNVVLPDAENKGVGLSQQTRAGRWQVVMFIEEDEAPRVREAVEAARKRMEAVEGLLFVVGLGLPDPTLPGVDLFDESRKAATFFTGKPGTGIAVVTPGAQLAAAFEASQLDEAVTFCEKAYGAEKPEVITGAAPVLVIEDILEPELCAELIAFWKNNPKEKGTVASSAQGNASDRESVKRRDDVVLPANDLFDTVKARLGRRVLPLMERAYRFRVASMEALRIGGYDAANEGAFGRHRDNTTPYTAHRRFALTLNLNTGDYDGGALRFPEYGRGLYQPPAGGGVVFSCSLLHEAQPVTRGLRLGMFTFFTDAEGLRQEKAMHQQQQQQQA